jgi:hypothetical protein
MRAILDKPVSEQGAFFDALRKNYPVRREFRNTLITDAPEDRADILDGLGFKVCDGC